HGRSRRSCGPKERLRISRVRSEPGLPNREGMGEAPARAGRPIKLRRGLPREGRSIWIQLPIAEAERLNLAMPRYCEALRCQSKQRTATTVHALITGHGEANFIDR